MRNEVREGGRGQIMQGCGKELDFILLKWKATGELSESSCPDFHLRKITLTAVWVMDHVGTTVEVG